MTHASTGRENVPSRKSGPLRWTRFSLLSVLLLIALVATALAWVRYSVTPLLRESRRIEAANFGFEGVTVWPANPKWFWRAIGRPGAGYAITVDFWADAPAWGTKTRVYPTREALNAVQVWRNVQRANLFGPDIDDEYLIRLLDSRQLTVLQLTNTSVTDDGVALLARLEGLSDLRIDEVPLSLDDASRLRTGELSDRAMEAIGRINSLTALTISSERLTDQGLVHLEKLPHLFSLTIYADGVTSEGLAHLGRIASLRSLTIHSDQISDSGLRHLVGLRDLKDLEISFQPNELGKAFLEQITPALLETMRVRPFHAEEATWEAALPRAVLPEPIRDE